MTIQQRDYSYDPAVKPELSPSQLEAWTFVKLQDDCATAIGLADFMGWRSPLQALDVLRILAGAGYVRRVSGTFRRASRHDRWEVV